LEHNKPTKYLKFAGFTAQSYVLQWESRMPPFNTKNNVTILIEAPGNAKRKEKKTGD
jgi:hypothetical protein